MLESEPLPYPPPAPPVCHAQVVASYHVSMGNLQSAVWMLQVFRLDLFDIRLVTAGHTIVCLILRQGTEVNTNDCCI